MKLHVKVVRAAKLGTQDSAKPNAYCSVYVNPQKREKTEIIPGNADPQWNQDICLSLASYVTSAGPEKVEIFGYLTVDVWDSNVQDTFLGRVMISIRSIAVKQEGDGAWYNLRRSVAKEVVSGRIKLVTYLELSDRNECDPSYMNIQLYNVCKSRGYHIMVANGKNIIDFPGLSEHIEMAFSNVLVEMSSHVCNAQVYLTNYRLIILCTSDLRQRSGQEQLCDLSMWIALNNLFSMQTSTETLSAHNQETGCQESLKGFAVHLVCHDFRAVKLLFVPHKKAVHAAVEIQGDKKGGHRLLKAFTSALKELPIHRSSSFGGAKVNQDTIGQLVRHHSAVGGGALSGMMMLVAKPSLHNIPVTPEEFTGEEDSMDGVRYSTLHQGEDVEEPRGQTISSDATDGLTDVDELDDVEMDASYILGHSNVQVELTPPKATTGLVKTFLLRLEYLVNNVAAEPPAFEFMRLCEESGDMTGWDPYGYSKEMMNRLGVKDDKKWKLTSKNGPSYALCPTYPQLVYVPANTESLLEECSKFRSKGRFPCLVWLDSTYGNFMLRCAQPLSGAAGKHCEEDERLLSAALDVGPPNGHMMIFDARSFSAAAGNKFMGKGTEDVSRYVHATLTYLDIPNIHVMRESYDALRQVCLSHSSLKWHSAVENTQWLNHLSLLLKGSTTIARYMKLKGGSALVHCSDGWDRTSQLTSLSQIMMDSEYRTINGFMVLVDKEWLSFGHRFQDRLGHPAHPQERSPIFLQFLDCTHQLLNQFPGAFEFNLQFLLTIADHLNSSWFGTFIYNCDKERHEKSVFANTLSVWAHITAERGKMLNPQYCALIEPIYPICNVRRLRLWEEYFLRYDYTALLAQSRDCDVDIEIQGSVLDNTDTPVVWLSDEKIKECSFCQQRFSTFRRRHHCRSCGRVFCHDCSKNKGILTHLGYTQPVRICDECYKKTLTQNVELQDDHDGYILVSEGSRKPLE